MAFNIKTNSPFAGTGNKSRGGFSLEKLSVDDLRRIAEQYTIELVCGGVVLLTLAGLGIFVAGRLQAANVLQVEIQALSDKEDPVLELAKAKDEFNKLIDALPEVMPEGRFITHITLLANKRDVTVVSISPPKYKDEGFFKRGTIQMTCSVDDFRQALFFLNDVERSPYAMKVGKAAFSISGRTDPGNDQRRRIMLTITLSSIELFDEKNQKKQ